MQIKLLSHGKIIERVGFVMRINYNWAKEGVHTFHENRKRHLNLDLQETIVAMTEILVF